MRRCLLVGAALALLLTPSAVVAQTTTGTIDGVIRDTNGGALPGVVVVTNSPSLIQRDLTVYSDASGYFRLSLLSPGTYEIAFTIQGVQPLQRTGLIVRVGQTTTEDVTLEVAAVQESITVVGTAPLIDPRNAKLAFNYTSELMENIPTARTINGLYATIPGVESANNLGVYQPGVVEIQNVLGAGERANSYNLDGANITDPAGYWNMQSQMAYDIVEEIQVVKSAKPAEIPFQGAYFNTITKSGGNELHGEFGGYFSGDALQGTNAEDIRQAAGVESSNELVSEYEVTASLGGRIILDKLWWYGSTRKTGKTSSVFGFPSDIDNDATAGSGKLTYQADPDHRFTAFVTGFQQDVSHYVFGFPPSKALDELATAVRPVDAISGGVAWSGVLSPTVFAEVNVTAAKHGFDQGQQPGANSAPVLDLANGDRSKNLGDGTREQNNNNVSVRGALSWFVPEAAGRHEIKVGFEYAPTTSKILFDDFEDHRLHTLTFPGVPARTFAVRFLSTPSLATWDNDSTSFYAQDSWGVSDRLTINAGFRVTHTVATTPETPVSGGHFAGTAIADRFPALNRTTLPATDLVNWTTIEPRFALTYSVDPSGRTVVRLGVSRYYQALPTFFLFVSNPAFPLNFVTLWFDRNGDRAFQIGEDGPLLFSFGGQLNPVDDDVSRPYTNEFMIGASHELERGLQVSANFIYRRDLNLAATVDAGVPFSSYTPVDVVDPGPDGVVGSGDDGSLTVFAQDPDTIGQSRNLLTNPDGNDRTFTGLELTASKRFSDNWQGVASLVVSRMEVIQPTTANQTANLFDDPNGLINAEGLDQVNRTVQFKLQGTYLTDFGLHMSGFYRFLTGSPYTRELLVTDLPQGPFNVFAEPRGSSKTDNTSIMDLRFEQRLDLADGRFVGIILDIFNVFNAAPIVDRGTITGDDYGDPRAVFNPRVARVGVRFGW
jgi:hypothetical protein